MYEMFWMASGDNTLIFFDYFPGEPWGCEDTHVENADLQLEEAGYPEARLKTYVV